MAKLAIFFFSGIDIAFNGQLKLALDLVHPKNIYQNIVIFFIKSVFDPNDFHYFWIFDMKFF